MIPTYMRDIIYQKQLMRHDKKCFLLKNILKPLCTVHLLPCCLPFSCACRSEGSFLKSNADAAVVRRDICSLTSPSWAEPSAEGISHFFFFSWDSSKQLARDSSVDPRRAPTTTDLVYVTLSVRAKVRRLITAALVEVTISTLVDLACWYNPVW